MERLVTSLPGACGEREPPHADRGRFDGQLGGDFGDCCRREPAPLRASHLELQQRAFGLVVFAEEEGQDHTEGRVNWGTHSQPQRPFESVLWTRYDDSGSTTPADRVACDRVHRPDSSSLTLTDRIASDRVHRKTRLHQHAREAEMHKLIQEIRALEQEVQVLEDNDERIASGAQAEDEGARRDREIEVKDKLKQIEQGRARLAEVREEYHAGLAASDVVSPCAPPRVDLASVSRARRGRCCFQRGAEVGRGDFRNPSADQWLVQPHCPASASPSPPRRTHVSANRGSIPED